MQRLLTAKLERDLGRPLERTSNRNGPMAIKSGEDMAIVAAGGNVVSHEPEQVREKITAAVAAAAVFSFS